MNYSKTLGLVLASSGLLAAGCNFEGGGSGGTGGTNVQLDATTDWAFFSFDSGLKVTESDDWDVAFNRTTVRTNTDRVEVALANEQEDFYDSDGDAVSNVFLNATANSENEHLMANFDVDDLSFEEDEYNTAINREGTGAVHGSLVPNVDVADSDTWLLLRSAEGDSFAKFRLTEYKYNMDNSATPPLHRLDIEGEFFVQAAGDSSFSATAVTWTRDETSENCFDFDSGATVGCEGDTWDIQYSSDGLKVNGGSSATNSDNSGGVYIFDTDEDTYGMTKAQIDNITDASNLNARLFTDDEFSTFFYDNSWYAYNLANQHKIYPNYRVYAVQNTDSEAVHLFQITGYYDANNESGNISLKYREL